MYKYLGPLVGLFNYTLLNHSMEMMTWLRKPKPTKGWQLAAEEDE